VVARAREIWSGSGNSGGRPDGARGEVGVWWDGTGNSGCPWGASCKSGWFGFGWSGGDEREDGEGRTELGNDVWKKNGTFYSAAVFPSFVALLCSLSSQIGHRSNH
jgi:hypothetical protein